MDNCTCVYADYGENLPAFTNLTNPTAKKIHKCSECHREIKVGEKYFRDSGKWDDGFFTFKMCSPCREIIDSFFCEGFAYGNMTADLYEHIQEVDGQISEFCLARLSRDARETICNLMEEYWNNQEE